MTGDFLLGVFMGVLSSISAYAALIIYEAHWGE
jgi:hypothetical protein